MTQILTRSADVPAIETERLVLRGHRPADLEASAAMWADPAVVRHIGGRAASREDVWRKLLAYSGLWRLLGFGYWLVEEKTTGGFVGEVGFADFKRELTPSLEGMPEMGWALAPLAQGKGYATEAVRAAAAWGEARFGPCPFSCLIHPENLPSLRVAEKVGFREFARTAYKGDPAILLRREVQP